MYEDTIFPVVITIHLASFVLCLMSEAFCFVCFLFPSGLACFVVFSSLVRWPFVCFALINLRLFWFSLSLIM